MTTTVTVTKVLEVEARASDGAAWPDDSGPDDDERPLPPLKLEVFKDGCGVIRSEAAEGVKYRNLTWKFLDEDGFQVLGRNAQTETRYRYFAGGTYTVVLEAFVGGSYAPVSNEVTVHC